MYIHCVAQRAKLFQSRGSQAVRLPKEFRFETDIVLVHRQGRAVVMTPAHEWPQGYAESFAGVADDFTRPPQGEVEKRTSLR